jgi:palmitoyl-protein thioesterase
MAHYKKNLASLDALVLIMFSEDRTVIPKESGWFGSYKAVNLSEPNTASIYRPLHWCGLLTCRFGTTRYKMMK